MPKKSRNGRPFGTLRTCFLLSLLATWSIVVIACSPGAGPQPEIPFTDLERRESLKLSPLPELPTNPTNKVADDPKAVQFGQFLFFDPRLSGNGKVSCATCHDPQKGWSDGLAVSKGVGTVTRNAPTIWNTAYNRWYFWDGRADSLWAQAVSPIEAPPEMGSNRLAIAHLIASDPKLKQAYEAIFGALPDISDTARFPKEARPVPSDEDDPQHKAWVAMRKEDQATANRIFTNVTKAIAAYERKIITKDAPFDRFIDGWRNGDAEKLKAISASAQRGLKIFVGKGACNLCHTGPNFTDNEFHNIGLGISTTLPADRGRFGGIDTVLSHPFNGLGDFSDKQDGPHNDKLRYLIKKSTNISEFKTPTLRNIEQNPPYMHDGRFATLKDVITFYSKLESSSRVLGHREESLKVLDLTDAEIDDLIAFLKSLTGQPLPNSLTTAPQSPLP